MSATSDSCHVVIDSDDIFSDDSSTTKVASDTKDAPLDGVKAALLEEDDAPGLEVAQDSTRPDYDGSVFWWLIAFRLLNAFMTRTFFQPDEYFQSLEPAWDIAFGPDSGAWITWEWRHAMRSTIPPFMFASLYWIAARLADYFQLSVSTKAELLIAAPKTLQACIAAVGDYYTWKLGELAYGRGELGHCFALLLTIANPFHFSVVTRTLANSTELSLNAAALYLWFTSAPEDPTLGQETRQEVGSEKKGDSMSGSWISTKLEVSTVKVKEFVVKQVRAYDLNRLRLCLILAAVGCILRITNVLTWLALVSFEFVEYRTDWHYVLTIRGHRIHRPVITPKLRELSNAHLVLVREAVLCGSAVLALSIVLDKQYYGRWTLPAAQFLYVNIAEGISSFYGTHDILWYFTQGLPLILGAFVVFAFVQIRYYLFTAPQSDDDFPSIMKYEFSAIALLVPIVFSFIGHKEARFIYPLAPILHTLAAGPAAEFFRPLINLSTPSALFANLRDRRIAIRFGLAVLILFINVLITIIVSLFHQKAPLDVLDYLRHEHEALYLSQPPAATGLPVADASMTVGFLMPCHSTPWRSHLVHPDIKAWALGCEPPLGIDRLQRSLYRDEADQFYDDPEEFLQRTLGPPKRAKKAGWGWKGSTTTSNEGFGTYGRDVEVTWDGKPGKKIWPEYLVFFAEKEDLLAKVLADTNYVQCWRGWNTWWHDDWRRRGDMIVWCLKAKPLVLRMADSDGVMAKKLTRKLRGKEGDSSKA